MAIIQDTKCNYVTPLRAERLKGPYQENETVKHLQILADKDNDGNVDFETEAKPFVANSQRQLNNIKDRVNNLKDRLKQQPRYKYLQDMDVKSAWIDDFLTMEEVLGIFQMHIILASVQINVLSQKPQTAEIVSQTDFLSRGSVTQRHIIDALKNNAQKCYGPM